MFDKPPPNVLHHLHDLKKMPWKLRVDLSEMIKWEGDMIQKVEEKRTSAPAVDSEPRLRGLQTSTARALPAPPAPADAASDPEEPAPPKDSRQFRNSACLQAHEHSRAAPPAAAPPPEEDVVSYSALLNNSIGPQESEGVARVGAASKMLELKEVEGKQQVHQEQYSYLCGELQRTKQSATATKAKKAEDLVQDIMAASALRKEARAKSAIVGLSDSLQEIPPLTHPPGESSAARVKQGWAEGLSLPPSTVDEFPSVRSAPTLSSQVGSMSNTILNSVGDRLPMWCGNGGQNKSEEPAPFLTQEEPVVGSAMQAVLKRRPSTSGGRAEGGGRHPAMHPRQSSQLNKHPLWGEDDDGRSVGTESSRSTAVSTSLQERLQPLLEKIEQAAQTSDSQHDGNHEGWMRRATSWKMEIVEMRQKAKAIKAEKWASSSRRQTLSYVLEKQKTEEEEAVLDNKQHSRFGPYAFKDVMDFKNFYETNFDSDNSGKFSMEASLQQPLFKQRNNAHAQHLARVLRKLHAERKQTLYMMEDLMEVIFPFAKHEERRRMVALLDIHRVLKDRVRIVKDSLRHQQQSSRSFRAPALDQDVETMADLELEIQDLFSECLSSTYGTVTLREMPDILQSTRLARVTLSELEKYGNKSGVDSHKELTGNDMLALLRAFKILPAAHPMLGKAKSHHHTLLDGSFAKDKSHASGRILTAAGGAGSGGAHEQWTQHWDDEVEFYYYLNRANGEISWERPPGFQ